jgi:hypothetical protein
VFNAFNVFNVFNVFNAFNVFNVFNLPIEQLIFNVRLGAVNKDSTGLNTEASNVGAALTRNRLNLKGF